MGSHDSRHSKEGAHLHRAKFWRKFLRLTRGRVAVLRALDVICEEEPASPFRDCIRSVRASMDAGAPLSEAIGAFPAEFSLSVRELVKTAEKTGSWDEIVMEIADGLQDGTFD